MDRRESIEEQLSTARYLRPKDWHVGFIGENFANLSDVNAAVVAVTGIAEKKKTVQRSLRLFENYFLTIPLTTISDRLHLYYIGLVSILIAKIFQIAGHFQRSRRS